METASQVARHSLHAIDAYHEQFKQEVWESREQLEDPDRLPEPRLKVRLM